MAEDINKWSLLCRAAEDLGAQDYARQGEQLTVAELRERLRPAAVRRRMVEQLGALPDDDAVIAERLLPAYERGRKSGRIDMDEVVRHIVAAGVLAYVGHSGGGCATIYAGRLPDWPDAHGDRRYPVLVGPGTFTAPDWKRPFSDAGDFWCGPDDDGDTKPVKIADGTPPEKVAELVVEKVRQAEARSKRIAKAVEAAGDAFWATVAAAFPEATAGDFPPDATLDIERAQRQAVQLWLHYNAPEGGIAATGPAPQPTVPDGRYGYVEWATHDESARGKWRFRLAHTVTDLHAAWTAAVDDFADDLAAFTYAVDNNVVLSEHDLVMQYPAILARHGLTYVPEPEPAVATINVDGDTILVDGADDRCRALPYGEKLRCGALLDDDGQCSKNPMDHHRDID